MSSRDEILSAIRLRRVRNETRPASYHPASIDGDLIAQFAKRAASQAADVRRLSSMDDVPAAVADILRGRNMQAVIHLPPGSPGDQLPWQSAPGLTREAAPPGPDDAALAIAPFAIAETGTLAYTSAIDAPASWHFRAGLEIAVLRADSILPHLEEVIAKVKARGEFPRTVNLVTGPSRTGDIEQTLELGAHGPKALAILIVDG
ncbi:MAG: LUD domain-containing protein [Rhizomicrobium sp.]|jgi:L-lactate dehydrogenase complex protein LldG